METSRTKETEAPRKNAAMVTVPKRATSRASGLEHGESTKGIAVMTPEEKNAGMRTRREERKNAKVLKKAREVAGKEADGCLVPAHYSDPDSISFMDGGIKIPDTQSQSIKELWEHAANAAKEIANIPSTTVSDLGTINAKALSPDDNDFREQVIDSRGIMMQIGSVVPAHEHFKVEKAEGDRASLKRKRAAAHCTIWLEARDGFIQEVAHQFLCLVHHNMYEMEYASYATETIFRQEPLKVPHAYRLDQRDWKAERMLKIVTKPDLLGQWMPPPVLDG